MTDLKLKISGIVRHCCDVKTFQLKLERDIFYEPGQYLFLTLKIHERDVTKVFSISSSPTETGHIDFTKKLTGSDFSNALNLLSVGDEVAVRMPMGRFVLKEEYKKIAFLSGGIGITPIRSILKYTFDLKLPKDIILLYSGHDVEHLIFKDDFDRMRESDKYLEVVYVLTGKAGVVFGFESGRIDAGLIRRKIQDYAQRIFFICGPPGMVRAMREILEKEIGVAQEQIVTEDFSGY